MPDNRLVRRIVPPSTAVGIHLQHRWRPLDRPPNHLYCAVHSRGTFSPNTWSPDAHQSQPIRCSIGWVWNCGRPISSIRALSIEKSGEKMKQEWKNCTIRNDVRQENVENSHTQKKLISNDVYKEKNLQKFKTLSLIWFQAIFKLVRHVHAKKCITALVSVTSQQNQNQNHLMQTMLNRPSDQYFELTVGDSRKRMASAMRVNTSEFDGIFVNLSCRTINAIKRKQKRKRKPKMRKIVCVVLVTSSTTTIISTTTNSIITSTDQTFDKDRDFHMDNVIDVGATVLWVHFADYACIGHG